MAKYEDYVKDDLEQEIEEAADNAAQRQDEVHIPDRFKGKSLAEVAQAYEELERLQGRQALELGQYRKLVDGMAPKSEEQPAKATERKPLTVDEIYENADESVRRTVREETQSRIEELEKRLAEADRRAALAAFEAKHPNYKDLVQDPSFMEWIKRSEYRVRQALEADKGDLSAADDLFSTYAELTGQQQEQSRTTKREAVKRASLERSGGSAPPKRDTFSRSKLQEVRIRARQGDSEAERYLAANAEAIALAYEENRLSP